jgi:peptide/nickel transport system ATP-binding protein
MEHHPMNPATPLHVLELSRLNVSFGPQKKRLLAVRDVSLTIDRGKALGLIGESGSGKSTVAFSIMRHTPGIASSDKLAFDGQELTAMSAGQLREIRGRRIAMVYQDPMNSLNPVYKVGAQVAEVLRYHRGLSKAQANLQVIKLFDQVRLPTPADVVNRYPHQLSGGQQQRVVIAMALACNPDLLIMDEPTTGLDVTTEAVILDLIADLRRDLNLSVLFISHNLSVVARVCDDVAVLYAGQIVEQGSVDDVLVRPSHPYTVGLLRAMPRTDVRLARLHSMPGSIPDLHSRPSGCVFRERCFIADDVCSRDPGLSSVADGHMVRCHFPVRGAEDVAIEAVYPAACEPSPDPRPEPCVRIDGVSKVFGAGVLSALGLGASPVRAVSDVSLSLDTGKTLAIVGESGSGKSTLARCIAGILPPTRGRIILDGNVLDPKVQRRDRAHQQAIQFIFQNPDSSLNQQHTVAQVLARPLKLYGAPGDGNLRDRTLELLDAVKLSQRYLERYPHELSGGEKQRVCIARAFAARPRVIICDEPTSALDISVQAAILNELNRLQKEFGTSYVFISHDLAVVRQISDSVAVMKGGFVLESGSADSVFSAPQDSYTKLLLKSSGSSKRISSSFTG